MTWTQFEEKEYETPLFNQLGQGVGHVWSPGQVFEEYIGIDYSIFIDNPALWRYFGYHTVPPGICLPWYAWDYIWSKRGAKRKLPSFRLNLFVQSKRAQLLSRVPKRLRTSLSNTSCFKFTVNPEQQIALQMVAERAKNRALVAYAAPVFHRFSQLWAHTTRGSIVQNSTFPDVNKLKGHSAWYYNSPGAKGAANPQWEFVDDIDLQERMLNLRAAQNEQPEASPEQNLQDLAHEINTALLGMDSSSSSRAAIYFDEARHLKGILHEVGKLGTPLDNFLHITLFAQTHSLEWRVI